MATTDVIPCFSKVFVSQDSSDSLLIPIPYNDQLPLLLFNTAILQGPGGRSWNVGMKREQDDVYLEHGWARFVEDNNLSDGYSLTFVYNGDNIFEVSIYDHNGEKVTRAVTEVEDSDDKEDSVYSINSEDTSSEFEVAKTIPKRRKKGKKEVVESSVANLKKQEAAKKSRKVEPKIKNPEKYLHDPKNIHFETNVKNRISELAFPAHTVKDYSLKFGDYVEYIDGKGNNIKAETAEWKNRSWCIKKWSVICKRNKLKKGDPVLCELLRKRDVVYAIRVHIIRGIDLCWSENKENSNSDDSSYAPDNEDIVTCVKPKVANLKKQEAAKKSRKVEPKIKNPKKYLDDPENIHFETNVKNRIYELVVPAHLVKDYSLKFGDYVEYIDGKGNNIKAETAAEWNNWSWCIKKWSAICRRNNLKKEDRVLCELLRKRDVVYAIRVHIFRGIDL